MSAHFLLSFLLLLPVFIFCFCLFAAAARLDHCTILNCLKESVCLSVCLFVCPTGEASSRKMRQAWTVEEEEIVLLSLLLLLLLFQNENL